MSSLKVAIEQLLDLRADPADALARHFAPEFRQRVNGTWIDRATFFARIQALRASLERADIEVLDEFHQDDRMAQRHIITVTPVGGTPLRQEVYVFARRDATGRFLRIEEATVES